MRTSALENENPQIFIFFMHTFSALVSVFFVNTSGESMTKSKSTGTIDPNKKPQGILKNKLPAGKTHSDTNGYIKRDTVQKILDQQRKVSILYVSCSI